MKPVPEMYLVLGAHSGGKFYPSATLDPKEAKERAREFVDDARSLNDEGDAPPYDVAVLAVKIPGLTATDFAEVRLRERTTRHCGVFR